MKEAMDRILRREAYSSRAPLSIIAAIVIGLLAVYGLLEAMLRVLRQPPWLLDPPVAARWIADLPHGVSSTLLGVIGAVVVLLGLVALANALLPGRRARHVIPDPRVAVVVDDEVIASALARRARTVAGVTREQVMVVVSRAAVQVNIRPTSGIRLAEEAIRAAVQAEVDAMVLDPRPAVRVQVGQSGVIGV
ncbi:DUF6286 domain-containing protein [Specibacter cremeus]|uniref:DUF6286 domain-containing protein n=1 Tax=Specibacter cremeus TaxID=1629051 RepID=UPI001F0B8440|nr:DUF6286 domain-containing protein [Specibacter cremeus]